MNNTIQILVLGTAQDGGYPHTGCKGQCCRDAWNNKSLQRLIASIAIIDTKNKQFWIIDITPDFKNQLDMIYSQFSNEYKFSGIFLTHAHVGHYTGIFELGLEILNTNKILTNYKVR